MRDPHVHHEMKGLPIFKPKEQHYTTVNGKRVLHDSHPYKKALMKSEEQREKRKRRARGAKDD